MPNIATVLKAEISRVARKAVRLETDSLRKTTSAQRSDIAALKRRMQEMEKAVKVLTKLAGRAQTLKPPAPAAEQEGESGKLRFRIEGLASNRKRLGLSVAEFALLVGVSEQSVYNWENGTTRPQAKHLPAIAALRGIGKREAATRLEALKQTLYLL